MPRFSMPFAAAFDGNGRPLAGAKLQFYAAGTTTPLNTYADKALSTPNTNPVVADAAGRWPAIWLGNEAYKVVMTTAAGATVWTADDVRVADPELSASETVEGLARIATQAEAEAGTNDAAFVTPKKLRLGIDISPGETGHVKLPKWLGGVTIQWGTAVFGDVFTNPQTGGPYAFSTPFSTACLAVVPALSTIGASTNLINASVALLSKSTTGFSVVMSEWNTTDVTDYRVTYIAVGY